jgi:hypothetical protein
VRERGNGRGEGSRIEDGVVEWWRHGNGPFAVFVGGSGADNHTVQPARDQVEPIDVRWWRTGDLP